MDSFKNVAGEPPDRPPERFLSSVGRMICNASEAWNSLSGALRRLSFRTDAVKWEEQRKSRAVFGLVRKCREMRSGNEVRNDSFLNPQIKQCSGAEDS